MKLLAWRKDGGPESRVHGLFFIEIKSLFTIALLRFSDGSRDAYHSHAFNALSWVLSGALDEYVLHEPVPGITTWVGPFHYRRAAAPIYTPRHREHKVVSRGTTWVLSFRGPWAERWYETINGRTITLTHGRKEVA